MEKTEGKDEDEDLAPKRKKENQVIQEYLLQTEDPGYGSATFFWHDLWLLHEPLATAFPPLFSHHTQQHSSVQ
jgi:hypothetical protein